MNIVIIGMNSTGVDLYKILEKHTTNFILVGEEKELGMSLQGKKLFIDNYKDQIISYLNENIKEKCFLFVTSDYFNSILMTDYENNHGKFNDNINYIGINYKFYKKINNKMNYDDFLKKYKLNAPLVYHKDSSLNNITFPVIFKYNGSENKSFIYKSKVIESVSEFSNEIKQDYIDSYVIQNYYNPSMYKQYSYGCYVSKGNIIVDIFVKQNSQFPQGVSTLVSENHQIPESVINKIKCLLETERYSGFIEFEMLMSDSETVIIDINPRTWGWFYILMLKYKNLAEILLLQSIKPSLKKKKKIVWINYTRLVLQVFKERRITILKHIQLNRYIQNNLLLGYLYLKKKVKK